MGKSDLAELRKLIESVEPGFCPACCMILDFRNVRDKVKFCMRIWIGFETRFRSARKSKLRKLNVKNQLKRKNGKRPLMVYNTAILET